MIGAFGLEGDFYAAFGLRMERDRANRMDLLAVRGSQKIGAGEIGM